MVIGKGAGKGKHTLSQEVIAGQWNCAGRAGPVSSGLIRMKGIVPIVGWVLLGLALVVSFGIDCSNLAQGGAIDFRNRITGVRLMARDIDPYHYKWHRADPEEYCDPYNNPNVPVSKTTASPTLLILHLPLEVISYRAEQFVWLVLQWLLLLGTAWLWWCRCGTSKQRWLLAIFVTGLTYTAAWRLHAERGQAYVVMLFVFAGWLALTLDAKRGNGFIAGLIAGFLTALRPPLLAILPFLALHRRGQLIGAGAGLLLSVVLPMLWQSDCWPDYFSAMNTYSTIYRTDFDPHTPQAYPPDVEGIPLDTLAGFKTISYADFSAHALLKVFGAEPFPALFVLVVAGVPYALWLWLSRAAPVEGLLVGLAAWMFILDLFLPSYRNNYNDILILNIFALALIRSSRIPWGVWPCLVAIPLGWYVYAAVPEQAVVINLPTFCFTVGVLVFLFSSSASLLRTTSRPL
jgi:hypothetical protein